MGCLLKFFNSHSSSRAIADSKKLTIVVIPGAWHVPATYAKLTVALRDAGYEVHIPTLPSVSNERPPKADLYADTEVAKDFVSKLADGGHTLIMILHSYGGQVGTNALAELSLQARSKRFGHMDLVPLAFDFAEDDSVVVRAPKVTMVGEGVPDDEADAYINTFLR
ncbi:hypothetical protein DTO271D3_6661 [Paecilomyces variotii]|nr:hypothetical protein DTO271D3_6661 [Paecilomyces variotii]